MFSDTKDYDEMKGMLNTLFARLRKDGFIARQNFSCCSGCGSYEINDSPEATAGKGYVFYHRQGTDHLKRDGHLHLHFGAVGSDSDRKAKLVAKKVVELAREIGLVVKWDGSASTCVEVSMTETVFVALGPLAWGKSEKSIAEAERIMRTQVPRSYLGKGKHKFPVYKIVGRFLGVDGMGSINYKGKLEQVHEGFLMVR